MPLAGNIEIRRSQVEDAAGLGRVLAESGDDGSFIGDRIYALFLDAR